MESRDTDRTPRRRIETAIALAALLLAVGPAFGQSNPRVETSTEGESPSANGESADDETKPERPPKRPGVEQFDDVTVERVRPDALPPESNTDLPDVLEGKSTRLPTPPSVEELKKTAEKVRTRVFELVSIQHAQAPGDSTPIVHRGHAVLVSGPGEESKTPILVTSYFWVKKSDELYLVPPKLTDAPEESGTPTAQKRSLSEMTIEPESSRWLDEHRDQLVDAKLYEPDKHRNLVTVVPRPADAIDLPDQGLELFDLERESPVRLYGYSPQSDSGLSQTRLLESHPDKSSLVYYLQTTYSVVFGAPIVSSNGKLLVLTAFKHPDESDVVLTIPPSPIAAYVKKVLGALDG